LAALLTEIGVPAARPARAVADGDGSE